MVFLLCVKGPGETSAEAQKVGAVDISQRGWCAHKMGLLRDGGAAREGRDGVAGWARGVARKWFVRPQRPNLYIKPKWLW